MNYIILDLEATCWRKKPDKSYVNEIIEIGAVKINEQLETVSQFAEFVQPIKHPILSDFCTELTTIQQTDVQHAALFSEVLARFQAWIGEESYMLCSWGFYDRNQLTADCNLHSLPTEWLKHHISIKHQYWAITGTKRPMGMRGALAKENLTLTGTHHRGIDDAINIAKIFVQRFGEWTFEQQVD